MNTGMPFCLEEHMRYRVARSTLHGRKVYLAWSQGIPYTVTKSSLPSRKVYLTGLQGVELQDDY